MAIELIARRKNDRLTQEQLADTLGISRQYLNKIEKGKAQPSKRLEAIYDKKYPYRLLTVHELERICRCPFCNTENSPIRLLNDADDSNIVWRCPDCAHNFTSRESFHLIDEHHTQGAKKYSSLRAP